MSENLIYLGCQFYIEILDDVSLILILHLYYVVFRSV